MPRFLRRIEIMVHRGNSVTVIKSALEDDYHHFRVAMTIENQTISAIETAGLRTPYSLCAQAGQELGELRGLTVDEVLHTLPQRVDARLQCTHQLDLAGLAVSVMASGEQHRRFDIEVPRHVDGCTTARLWRNCEEILCWQIKNHTIRSPLKFAGVPLQRGFSAWARKKLDDETVEAALVLRRGAVISLGRLRNLDLEPHAKPLGFCYVQQSERATQAHRLVGSTQDFSDRSQSLCAEDQDWLHTQSM
jgi:hypothetical protein